jgi:hypothetical protein
MWLWYISINVSPLLRPFTLDPINLRQLSHIINRLGDMGVLMLLETFCYQSCFDPGDRVYGILNMPWIKNHRLDITPDYSLPTEGVYGDFFLRYTANLKSVELLRYYEMRGVASMPSWIPDLSVVKTASNLGVLNADG